MKICVVGAVNYDYIKTYEGEKQEGLGGILYAILPLAGLFGPPNHHIKYNQMQIPFTYYHEPPNCPRSKSSRKDSSIIRKPF